MAKWAKMNNGTIEPKKVKLKNEKKIFFKPKWQRKTDPKHQAHQKVKISEPPIILIAVKFKLNKSFVG